MVDTVHPRASDLFEQMHTRAIYDAARAEGISVSALMERDDPSDPMERRGGRDAFCRVLEVADILTTSDPDGTYYADRLEEFRRDANTEALFAEWAGRTWRKATLARSAQNRAPAVFLSADYALNTQQRPYEDDPDLRMDRIQPAIPLAEIIANQKGVDSPDVRTQYLIEPAAADVRMLRVTEAAELPRARLTTGRRTIRLHKFGRALEASYEALRRERIDHVAIYIQRLGVQTQKDQVTAALDVGINGDGNSGTSAVVYNLTTLDPGTTANNLTLKAYLAFRMKFTNPYAATAMFAQEDVALAMQLLNVGTANIMLASGVPGIGGFTPINPNLADGVRLGVTSDAPSAKIVGIDTRFALQRLVENGSEINEAERWITRQVEVLTMSMEEGFAVFDPNAVKILNLAA